MPHAALTIAKTRPGYYLQVAEQAYTTFLPLEENILIRKIKAKCQEHGYIHRQVVQSKETTFREKLITVAAGIPVRQRLLNTKLERSWVEEFVQRHKPEIANKIARIVDNTREAAFNWFTLGQFFAQVNVLYKRLGINRAEHGANLDGTGYIPGRDLCKGYRNRVVTEAGVHALIAKPKFKYPHSITVLATVFADESKVSPAEFFRGEREKRFSSETDSKKKSEVCGEPWCVY